MVDKEKLNEHFKNKDYIYCINTLQKDIARKYEIESIPTLIYFNNGMALKTLVGLRTKQDILNTIN